jgi:hypothetical protein
MAKEPSGEDAGPLRLSSFKASGLRTSCVEGLRELDTRIKERGFLEELESLKRHYERAGKTAKAEAIRYAIKKLRKV